MNQDEADRMAQEAELPVPEFSRDVHYSGVAVNKVVTENYYTEFQVRITIAALVKLTQQEPVAEVLSNRVGNDTSTIDKALPAGTKLYTRPAPSQQEERVRELEWLQINFDKVKHYFHEGERRFAVANVRGSFPTLSLAIDAALSKEQGE